MKKIIMLSIVSAIVLTGCNSGKKGDIESMLNGTEQNLPEHLNGLTVDLVTVSERRAPIYVATLPGHNTISMNYQLGKTSQSVIVAIPDESPQRIIQAREIIMENDSMILIKKAKN